MKKWTKPELYVEKFELSQTVATACSSPVTDRPSTSGGSITYNLYCEKEHGNIKGHWDHYDVVITDSDNDGKISHEEWTAAYDDYAARNDVTTGAGHAQHITSININTIFNS